MPTPMPPGQHFTINHGLFREHYQMASMQMATDHYNIGITLQGRRRTITPQFSYSYKAGDVALAPPYLFHRTIAESDGPYERIMIKFSPQFVKPFIKEAGQHPFISCTKPMCTILQRMYRIKSKACFSICWKNMKKTPLTEILFCKGCCFAFFSLLWKNIFPLPSHIKIPALLRHKSWRLSSIWRSIIKPNLPWRRWLSMWVFLPDIFPACSIPNWELPTVLI